MRHLVALALLASLGSALIGCSAGEVSEKDQASKDQALKNAESASQAKDGVKSE